MRRLSLAQRKTALRLARVFQKEGGTITMDWKREAENDLRCHEKRKAALESLADEIRELRSRTYGSSAPAADAVPVQGGTSTAEGRWIAAIDELERKKEAYRITKRRVDAVERGLAALDEQQREILDCFFINRAQGHAQTLAKKYHVEQSRIYQMKDQAVREFTVARYGVVES